jgi:hypothetical protein
MSTSASVIIYEEENNHPLTQIYFTQDGFPHSLGTKLCDLIKNIKIVNGLTDTNKKNSANGMGCLAAQIVAHFKTCPGNVYIWKPKDITHVDFRYKIHYSLRMNRIKITIMSKESVLYCGSPKLLLKEIRRKQ